MTRIYARATLVGDDSVTSNALPLTRARISNSFRNELKLAQHRCRSSTVRLEDVSPAAQPPSVDVLALGQAVEALSAIDARQAGVVELRFFAGLDIDEAAEALGISPATVERMGPGEGLAPSATDAARVTDPSLQSCELVNS